MTEGGRAGAGAAARAREGPWGCTVGGACTCPRATWAPGLGPAHGAPGSSSPDMQGAPGTGMTGGSANPQDQARPQVSRAARGCSHCHRPGRAHSRARGEAPAEVGEGGVAAVWAPSRAAPAPSSPQHVPLICVTPPFLTRCGEGHVVGSSVRSSHGSGHLGHGCRECALHLWAVGVLARTDAV